MVTRDDLIPLTEPKELAVSLFLPTERAGPPIRENPIRMKNRIQEVRHILRSHDWDDRRIDELLEPAIKLADDRLYWREQLGGLAMFLSEGEEHRLKVESSLPALSVIGSRYHLKPLLPQLEDGGNYWVLAGSLGESRLFEVAGDQVFETELPEGTPASLEDALRFSDREPEHQTVRRHTGARPGSGSGKTMLNQGRGGGAEYPDRKTDILYFFQQLDDGVREVIAGSHMPLVFVGVDYLFPIYREANRYPRLVEEAFVTGNPDQWDANEIRQRSWDAVRELFDRPRREALERYASLAGTGNTGDSLEEVIPAALSGRVETLFVTNDINVWGTYDPEARKLERLEQATLESEDLTDRAAVEALKTSARIFTLPGDEMPGNGGVAAIYRF